MTVRRRIEGPGEYRFGHVFTLQTRYIPVNKGYRDTARIQLMNRRSDAGHAAALVQKGVSPVSSPIIRNSRCPAQEKLFLTMEIEAIKLL